MLQYLFFVILILQTYAQLALYDYNFPFYDTRKSNNYSSNTLASEIFDVEIYNFKHMQDTFIEERSDNFIRANKQFIQCCEKSHMPKVCSEQVCRYGQNPDYVRSAFFTFCEPDNLETATKLFRCVNNDLDLYECCIRWTIYHHMRMPKHCCRLYMSYPPQKLYFTHTLVRDCTPIFEPMMVCAVQYF